MPYKSRESALAAARKVSAQIDREPNAAPERLHALATQLEAITSRTTPAGQHAHPWHWTADDIERERAALYRKAGAVLNQPGVCEISHRLPPDLRRRAPVEPWAKKDDEP